MEYAFTGLAAVEDTVEVFTGYVYAVDEVFIRDVGKDLDEDFDGEGYKRYGRLG